MAKNKNKMHKQKYISLKNGKIKKYKNVKSKFFQNQNKKKSKKAVNNKNKCQYIKRELTK